MVARHNLVLHLTTQGHRQRLSLAAGFAQASRSRLQFVFPRCQCLLSLASGLSDLLDPVQGLRVRVEGVEACLDEVTVITNDPVDCVWTFPVKQHLEETRPDESMRRTHMTRYSIGLVDATLVHFAALVLKLGQGLPHPVDFGVEIPDALIDAGDFVVRPGNFGLKPGQALVGVLQPGI